MGAEDRAQGLDLASTLHVMWWPPFGNGLPITGFNLSMDGGAPIYVPASEATPQYALNELVPDSSHDVRVLAFNALGAGEWSEPATFTTAKDVPGVPPAPEPRGMFLVP